MRKNIGTLILAVSFLFLTNAVIAQCDGSHSASAGNDCKSKTSKIALVKFSSDNCNASKNLETKIAELKGKFKEDVVFVKFDFTNDESKTETKSLADDQGLSTVLESNSGTGFMVVYDLKNKKVLTKLDNSLSVADMEKTVKSYL